MKKLIFGLFFLSLWFTKPVFGQEAFVINNFNTQITVNKDTSLTVREEFQVTFNENRHGIFRVIPVIYSARGRTIKADLDVQSVTDKNGKQIPFEVSRLNQSRKIKIGDPDKTIIGDYTYILTYRVDRILQRFEEYDELYWNVTGSEWPTEIKRAEATVTTEYANIKQIDCFAGQVGSEEKKCTGEAEMKTVDFYTAQPIKPGEDFTVVVGFNRNNQFNFPGLFQKTLWTIQDNWGYGIALLPFILMVGLWWKKGRDKRYLSDNVYFKPENKQSKTVSPFHRPHLPMTYHPIDNLTPAQVGTIIDERIDTEDVVAEIVELARLGYLKIERIEKKGIFSGKGDYWLIKLKEADNQLTDYQQYLFEKIFLDEKEKLKVSSLKNKFYKYLDNFKKKLYQSLVDMDAFPASPEKVRQRWIGLAILLVMASAFVVIMFTSRTDNIGPLFVLLPASVVGILIARFMPQKTAWGYSLHRQTKGLKYYLGKGKWREEIAEKHLFLEEMLPLAVSLGVVNRLAKDMADLGVEPPNYMAGITTANLNRNLAGFNTVAASAISSNPSGKSSWSGGSGFSGGGSSGGGFGGGGGGSW